MGFNLWAFDTVQSIWLPPKIWGYLLAFLYIALISVLARNQGSVKKWGAVIALTITGAFLSGLCIVYFPNPAGQAYNSFAQAPAAAAMPLFGALFILLLGSWSGPVPALVLGILSGLVRALLLSGRGLQVLELGVVAALSAYLMQQNYRSKLFSYLRNPVAAGLTAGLACIVMAFTSNLVNPAFDDSITTAVEYAWYNASVSVLPNLVEWLLAGVVVQVAVSRAIKPKERSLVAPPFSSGLTSRLLYTFIPILCVSIVVILVVVTKLNIDRSVDTTLQQMARDAGAASDSIPNFELASANALSRLADNSDLLQIDSEQQQEALAYSINLESELSSASLFQQLVLYDSGAEVVNSFPPLEEYGVPLHQDEVSAARQVVTLGHPRTAEFWAATTNIPMLSYIEPIKSGDGVVLGALMGRIDMNAALQSVVSRLNETAGQGRGFIVDQSNSIIAHTNADRLMMPWVPPAGSSAKSLDKRLGDSVGHAYQDQAPDGSHQLAYYLQVPGRQWTVVLMTPYTQALSTALKTTAPLAACLLFGGIILVVVLVHFMRQVSQSLTELTRAAGRLALMDLDTPVPAGGEDQIGRVGMALESMRQSLQAHLGERESLLAISQNTASTLDLSQGIQPLLENAIKATGADGVRIVIFSDQLEDSTTFAQGDLAKAMAPLDLPIARLLRRERMLRIDNTGRTRAILDTNGLADQVGAILAIPIRTAKGYQGILWIAHRENHAFPETEINFMTSLTQMASMLVEKVQSYQSAEDDRHRLSAIISGITDAIIVTNSQDRILLINPAAEAAFGINAAHAQDQRVEEVLDDPALIDMLLGKASNGITEIQVSGGRVLAGSVSSFTNDVSYQAGPSKDKPEYEMGKIVVLRDITHLKELDGMKSDFVNAVSHDLRNPLSYMRGYVSMLPVVGSLSPKQNEYMEKILKGIDQISSLVENTLNLAQIESEVEQVFEPVQVGKMIKAVAEKYRNDAESKGLEYVVAVKDDSITINGEPILLRQAVSNLIENSVKFTKQGSIMVRAFTQNDEVIVQVEDTGPGIAPTDQARLFEKFFRIRRRDDSEQKGSGLGLAIVRSIVEKRHGGRVWVESQLGAGSSFFIALPRLKG